MPELVHTVPPAELPQPEGCLPPGATLDALLTVEQFAKWRGISIRRAQNLIYAGMPGVIPQSRPTKIHPRTWLAKQGRSFREAVGCE